MERGKYSERESYKKYRWNSDFKYSTEKYKWNRQSHHFLRVKC